MNAASGSGSMGHHIIDTDRRPPRLPPGNGRLTGARAFGQFDLGQPSPPPRFTNQLRTVRSHTMNIPELIYGDQVLTDRLAVPTQGEVDGELLECV